MKILLNQHSLKFTERDLLFEQMFHARQIRNNATIEPLIEMYPGKDLQVLRIGDTQNEILKIPPRFKNKIEKVEKYCTKPELETLLIIAEGKWDDYSKKHLSPKEYAKANITYNRRRYDNSSAFYEDYFANRCNHLVEAIKKYKHIKKHSKDELFLADLLIEC